MREGVACEEARQRTLGLGVELLRTLIVVLLVGSTLSTEGNERAEGQRPNHRVMEGLRREGGAGVATVCSTLEWRE